MKIVTTIVVFGMLLYGVFHSFQLDSVEDLRIYAAAGWVVAILWGIMAHLSEYTHAKQMHEIIEKTGQLLKGLADVEEARSRKMNNSPKEE